MSSLIFWLRGLLYGSIPAEFESAYDLEESVRRLAAATGTGRSFFSWLAQQRAVGTVTETHVELYRFGPFDILLMGMFVKLYFRGRFERRSGHTTLTGRFTMHPLGKVNVTNWLGFVPLTVIASAIVIGFRWWCVVLVAMGTFSLGCTIVWIGRCISRDDPAWLSKVIENALSRELPSNEQKYGSDRHACEIADT
jgi:hypothetical protein